MFVQLILCLASLLSLFHISPCHNHDKNLNVGILLPWKGSWPAGPGTATAILIAFEDLSQELNLLPGYNISWVWMDTHCSSNEGVSAILTLKEHFDLHAFIGPPCSVVATRVSPMGKYFEMPMVSWSAASPLLSDKEMFPVFSRTVGPYSKMSTILLKTFEEFGWNEVAIVASNDDSYSAVGEAFLSDFINGGYDVLFYQTFTPVTAQVGTGSKEAWMTKMKKTGARIILVLGYCTDMRDALLTASDLEMIDGYAYILIDGGIEGCNEDTAGIDNHSRDEEALALFDGTLSLSWYTQATSKFSNFLNEMDNRRMDFAQYSHPPDGPLQPSIFTSRLNQSFGDTGYEVPSTDEMATLSSYAGSLYDAIKLYYYVANETLAEGYDPRIHGMKIVEKIKGFQMSGITGDVIIDENGDRNPDIELQNIRTVRGVWEIISVGVYSAASESMAMSVAHSDILWPGGFQTVPVSKLEVLPACKESDYSYSASSCNPVQFERYVSFSWNASVSCEGGVNLPDTLALECDEVPFKSSLAKGVISICVIGLVFGCFLLSFVAIFRKHPVIKASQPIFLVIFISSAMIVIANNLLYLGKPTTVKCVFRAWLFHLFFTSMFGSLFLKVYRVWRIFGNKNLRKIKILARDVLKGLAALVAVDVVLLTFWSSLSTPVAETLLLDITNVGEVVWSQCRPSTAFSSILGMYHVGTVLVGVYISFQTRSVSGKFSESKYIMFAIYQIALVGGLTLMVTSFEISLGLQVMIRSLGMTFSCSAATFCVMMPKVLRVWKPELFEDGVPIEGATEYTQHKPQCLESSSGAHKIHVAAEAPTGNV